MPRRECFAMAWMSQMQKIRDDFAFKCLEAQSGRIGSHWLPKQKTNSNKDQKLHDELNHVYTETLVDTLVQMKALLRE